ncbi:MAG: uracil-xanthine permease family protein [Vallitaleaceae bacterium]|jgi:uracil permease|nr:uracil-xanthine permease family protein [Vallitaleaceae bacterium]
MGNINIGKKLVLSLQHVLAMFGATVLVPIITGLDPAIALLAAGVGTLLFHLCAKGKVPVFLGSSFAFLGAIILVLNPSNLDVPVLRSAENWDAFLGNLALLKGGIIVAGVVYVTIAIIIYFVGVDKVQKLFSPIVTGSIIMVIGLRLSPIAISNAFYVEQGSVFSTTSLIISSIVVLTMILIAIFTKGFFKLVPILIAVVVGYIVSLIWGIVDTQAISDASFFSFSQSNFTDQVFLMPKFDWTTILAIAPIALVVFIEHIGDITTNSAVVGKDFLKDPGIHRTLLGDGIATAFAGLIGGPTNTTYSENTGVLAVTKVYDPNILRIAAVFAIILSLFGKVSAVISTIPLPVMGGISIILFGMIASIGVRIMVNANLDFSHSRNLIIGGIILVLGIGVGELPIGDSLTISGLAIAAIVGVILNGLLPKEI